MQPDHVCDARKLPFEDGAYDLIVFDPPHMAIGPQAQMAKAYGSYGAGEIRLLVRQAADELHRVLRPDGLLAFKWTERSDCNKMSLKTVVGLLHGFRPLFGHKVAERRFNSRSRSSSTYWVLLVKAIQ